MEHMQSHERDEQQHRRSNWALAGFLAIAAFFLLTEHRAHLLGVLPYLLILACPLLHIFHHGGHGHVAHRGGATDGDDGKPQVSTPGEQS